jgi:hypothetical protein
MLDPLLNAAHVAERLAGRKVTLLGHQILGACVYFYYHGLPTAA